MHLISPKNDVLWAPAQEVTDVSTQVVPYFSEMRLLMNRLGGFGLSATQVGIPYRFFIYGGRRSFGFNGVIPFSVVINPVIEWKSAREREKAEGCLSFPGRAAMVSRAEDIEVSAHGFDWVGNTYAWKSKRLGGVLARVFQHEIDHLNGICIHPREELKTEQPETEEMACSAPLT